MRLLFAGTPDTALPALRLLLDAPQHEVVGVLTRPDAPAGRNRRPSRAPVARLADEAGIPVYAPGKPGDPEFVTTLGRLGVDCAPVVAYGALLPEPILAVPAHGWVNLHFSLLPAWRGAAPVQRTILAGDEITGASTFRIEAGLDTGPVFGVTTEAVRPDDTSGSLLARLAESGAGLLLATLDGIEAGTLVARPQPADGVSVAAKITVADAEIDFDQPAVAIDRRIRACTPEPGAWTTWRGQRLKLDPVRPAGAPAGELSPGQLRVERTAVLVGTATRPVVLGRVQPPGKRLMAAADWARGARLTDADRLG